MPSETDDFQAAQTAEWSAYVAKNPIFIGGARAFNPGDQVPRSHVESGVVSREDVVGANTKTAKAVTGGEQ